MAKSYRHYHIQGIQNTYNLIQPTQSKALSADINLLKPSGNFTHHQV
jgi:hypothetical protein